MATLRDQLIANANSLPDLIAHAEVLDPALAQQLTGKSLFASRSAPAILIASLITWGATKYGLNFDATTVDLLTMAVGTIVAYAMRWITRAPITGLIHPAPVVADTGPGGVIALGASKP